MKRTTYILLGAIIFIFIGVIIYPYFLLTINKKIAKEKPQLITKNEIMTMSFDSISVIKFDHYEINSNILKCKAYINIDDSSNTRLEMHDSKHFTAQKYKDTLIISIKNEENTSKAILLKSQEAKINIMASKAIKCIYNDIMTNVILKNINKEDLKIYSVYGMVNIEKCNLSTLDVKGFHSVLKINETTIDSLHIDLDNNIELQMKDNVINTEFITGSDNSNNIFNINECKKIVWLPKKDNSNLTISSKEKCIIIPCNDKND